MTGTCAVAVAVVNIVLVVVVVLRHMVFWVIGGVVVFLAFKRG